MSLIMNTTSPIMQVDLQETTTTLVTSGDNNIAATQQPQQKSEETSSTFLADSAASVGSLKDELSDDVSDDEENEQDEVNTAENQDIEKFEASSKFPKSLLKPCGAQKIQVRKVKILCNPFSGNQRGKRVAEKSLAIFENKGIETDIVYLERKGHAEDICETMDIKSFDVIIIIGGDGTMHECVNGILHRENFAEEASSINLAVIPAGTGNSLVLETQHSISTRKAIRHILRGISVPIDLTEVYFPCEKDDKVKTLYSFNSIHWGLGSKVSELAEKLRWMGNAIRYTTAALYEVFRGDTTYARISFVDGEGNSHEYVDDFSLVIANNIITAAKGMKMAPDAKLNDGLIDLIIIRSSSTFDLMVLFKKIYDGTHPELPYVDYHQVKSFSITPFRKETKEVETETDPEISEEIIDVDGELKGLTPFSCKVIPKAIRIIM